jgi:pilus assembly protein FimV
MLRKSVVFLALLLCSLATQSYALGLGDVSVESALNQPLRVRIEILQLGDTRLQDISVQMASVADFQRFNIDRVSFLSEVRFSIAAESVGNFVTLSSNQIVREPYLSFILDTRWPNGRLLSEHTVLLDLPVFNEQQTRTPVRQPISPVLQAPRTAAQSAPAPAAAAPVVSTPAVSERTTEPETPAVNEVSSRDAEDVSAEVEPESAPDPVAELAEPDPVPAPTRQTTASAPAPAPAPTAQPESVKPLPLAAPASVEPEDSTETIQTSPNDTLTEVALRVRPNNAVTMQQTMLAIQRQNPAAFIDGNINRLRAGQVLRVPGLSEIQAVDAREAADEVSRQNRDFAASADVQPLAAPASSNQAQASAPQGQLTVVSGDDDAIDGNSSTTTTAAAENAALDERISILENQLAQQQEEADRARIQREEMQARMSELESQIAAAQEIIRLQDLRLAQLQDSLAEAAAQQAAIAAAEAQLAATTRASRPTLMDTVMGVVTSTTFFLIIGALVLILALVVVLLRRNRAKAESSDLDELEAQPFDARAADEDESDYLDFAEDDDLDSELEDSISKDEEFDADVDAAEDGAGTGRTETRATATTQSDSRRYSSDEEAERGAASFLDDLGIDLDAFNDDDDEVASTPTASPLTATDSPAAAPDIETDFESDDDETLLTDELAADLDLDDTPAPAQASADDDMDLTFDLSPDDKRDTLEFDDGEAIELTGTQSAAGEEDDSNALEFEVGDFSTDLTTDDAKAEDDSELETFEFTTDDTPKAAPEPEPALELETFEFDLDEKPSSSAPVTSAAAPATADDDNSLDFDFDKTEIKAPEPATDLAADLETFDFDLDAEPASTVVEKPGAKVDLDLDTDDFDVGEKTVIETDNGDVMLDFDLDDKDDDSADAVTGNSSSTAATDDLDENDLADLDFLSDDDDIEIESIGEAEEVSLLSNDDEVATKLELAYAYRKMGDKEGAREILEEVLKEGSQAQVKEANELLASLGDND